MKKVMTVARRALEIEAMETVLLRAVAHETDEARRRELVEWANLLGDVRLRRMDHRPLPHVPTSNLLGAWLARLPEGAELANQFLSLHERVWPAMLVALLLLGFHLVFFSHRIAGPLYRWRRLFSEVGAGNCWVYFLSITKRCEITKYFQDKTLL